MELSLRDYQQIGKVVPKRPVQDLSERERREIVVESMTLWDYRIINFDIDPNPAAKGQTVTVSGKAEKRGWWPWAQWGPAPSMGIALYVGMTSVENMDECKFPDDDGTFSFEVDTAPFPVGATVAVKTRGYTGATASLGEQVECPPLDQITILCESTLVYLEVVSEAPDITGCTDITNQASCEQRPDCYWYEGACHGQPRERPTFWEALRGMDIDALWKYHKGKTVALALGGLVLLSGGD